MKITALRSSREKSRELPVKPTYLGGLVLLIPPLLPEGLGPGDTIFSGQLFPANTTRLASYPE